MNDTTARLLAGGLFIISTVFSIWVLRRQYRLLGKLNWFGTLIHVTMYGFHGMFSGTIAWGNAVVIPEAGPAGTAGAVMMVIGFLILIIGMDLFRTFTRWLGSNTSGLKTSGLYRWSRNPQFIGYGLVLLGFFIAWWNELAWLGILSSILLFYAIARVEEEHLERVYGAEYRDYCTKVPRFFGIPNPNSK